MIIANPEPLVAVLIVMKMVFGLVTIAFSILLLVVTSKDTSRLKNAGMNGLKAEVLRGQRRLYQILLAIGVITFAQGCVSSSWVMRHPDAVTMLVLSGTALLTVLALLGASAAISGWYERVNLEAMIRREQHDVKHVTEK